MTERHDQLTDPQKILVRADMDYLTRRIDGNEWQIIETNYGNDQHPRIAESEGHDSLDIEWLRYLTDMGVGAIEYTGHIVRIFSIF